MSDFQVEDKPVETEEIKTQEVSNESAESENRQPVEIKETVPEKYEFKLPEGVELSEEKYKAFEPIAKELGLTNEKAQRLVELYTQMQNQDATSIKEQLANASKSEFEAKQSEYIEQAKSDKEFGGVNFEKNLAKANNALSRFANEEFIAELKKSGFANHPAMIKTWFNVAKAISEDTMETGAGSGGYKEIRSADVLFPSVK